MTIYMADNGMVGIVFRAEDEFNFYAFELS
jgi:hypothetical protein